MSNIPLNGAINVYNIVQLMSNQNSAVVSKFVLFNISLLKQLRKEIREQNSDFQGTRTQNEFHNLRRNVKRIHIAFKSNIHMFSSKYIHKSSLINK